MNSFFASCFICAFSTPIFSAQFSYSHGWLDGGGGPLYGGRFTAESFIAPFAGARFANVLNYPPSPRRDFIELSSQGPFSIPLSRLAANDVDLEGSTLNLSLAELKTSKGGAIALANGILTYTPPPIGFKTDSFSYLVTDSAGGSSLAKVILFSSASAPRLSGFEKTDTLLTIRFHALPDTAYMLQSRSTFQSIEAWLDFPNPLQPLIKASGPNGDVAFQVSVNSTNRFYRAVDLETLRENLTVVHSASRISMTLRGVPNTFYKLQFRSNLNASEEWRDYPGATHPFTAHADADGFYDVIAPLTALHGFFRTIPRAQ